MHADIAKSAAKSGLVGAVLLGLAFGLSARAESAKEQAKDRAKDKPAAAQPAEAAKPPKEKEKIAYTFPDQAKVDAFAKLWQQRQATVLRMTVLKSYFLEEEENLRKLNEQFAKDYNLDVAKNYRFDSDRKVIIEVEAPPAEQPVPAAPAASKQKGAP